MPKDKITVVEAELSLEEIAKALRITPEDALAKFQDPRVTSWFAEIWGERLFSYRKHLSSNHPGSAAPTVVDHPFVKVTVPQSSRNKFNLVSDQLERFF